MKPKIKKFLKKHKTIIAKILIAKFIVFLGFFLIRPPTVLIEDAKIYYELTKNPKKMFRPPGSEPSKGILFGKAYGFPLIIYPFFQIYRNWVFWALSFNFVFSALSLFLLYKITNEKIMWLLFFYPYFLYHQNFPLEVSVFTFLIVLAWYYSKKKNLLGNFICNLSSFFRPEGIIISFYYLLKKVNFKNLLIFLVITSIVLYTYAFSYVYLNYKYGTPFVAYPRLFIPFLIILFIDFNKVFTKHFWIILMIWVILGGMVGFIKIFYEWNVL